MAFEVKYKSDGTLDRYKACLVAKGFTKTPGLDYFQTFAPMAKMTTVRLILSLVVVQNLHVNQLDINNSFLHSDLHEKVYIVDLPLGVLDHFHFTGTNAKPV